MGTETGRDLSAASGQALDWTHDGALRSWVDKANGHPCFPIQNLPVGVVSLASGEPRGGVAIGEQVLDLRAATEAGLFEGRARLAAEAASRAALNGFFALAASDRLALRRRLAELFREGSAERPRVEPLLHLAAACTPHLPAAIGDYTDFYAGINHAENVGRLFRPDNPLLPNYKYVPIGYHGRASSIRPSGTPITRPNGQRKLPSEDAPTFGPSRNLDYELELGVWIGAGNRLGEPIPIAKAAEQVAGFCLVNDWSARDIQAWEYQPLGPFLSKDFGTTLSPWVILPEALAPFFCAQPPRADGDPKPLPYLWDEADQAGGALDLELEVLILTQGMKETSRPPERLSLGNAKDMYWTVAQLVAHHSCNGCNLQPGDLFGSGTISAKGRRGFGSLLEITASGRDPVQLTNGEARNFLQDGDEIILRAVARRPGFAQIGFGDCRAAILPAPTIS